MSEIIKEVGSKKDMILALLNSKEYEIDFDRDNGIVNYISNCELNQMLDVQLCLDSDYFNKEIYYQPRFSSDPCDVQSKGNLNIMELDPDDLEAWDDSDFCEVFYNNIDKIEVEKIEDGEPISECCGATIIPNTDICGNSDCGEHTGTHNI